MTPDDFGLIEKYGLGGLIIIGLVYAWKSERDERIKAQEAAFETLKMVFPMIEVLDKAQRFIERGDR